MRTLEQWMSEYAKSHTNPTNKLIHKICVPVIMFCVLGLFWSIPTPQAFQSVAYFNWATIFVLGCLVFYLTLSFKMFLAMLIETSMMLIGVYYLDIHFNLLQISTILFVLAWIFQFIGHKIEGKKPSFFQDLAFLLIGPLWVLRAFGYKG